MSRNNTLIGIGIVIAVIYLISLAPQQDWFPKGEFPFLSVINPNIKYSGFDFEDNENVPQCNVGGGSTSINPSGEGLILTAKSGNNVARRTIRTEITDVDEVLVLYDGYGTCSATETSSGAVIQGTIIGSESGRISQSDSVSCSREKQSNTETYKLAVWSFKNNFDKTWSITQRLGIGDIVKIGTTEIKGDKQYLELEARVGSACGSGGGGESQLRIYNIITKKSGFSICKIDERGIDKNNDGEITSDECTNLTTIDLQREEAILQSVAEQIRLLEELNQRKIDYLEAQIVKLQNKSDISLLERISQLEQEKEATSLLLGKLQSRDAELIYAIEQSNKVEIINKTIIIQEPVIPSPSSPIPTAYKIIGGILGVILLFKLFGVF